MDNDIKKIERSVKIYPFFEALSGELLFFNVIEILFLTLVKGLSVQEIALIELTAQICDLMLEYPSYLIIRKIGNSRSCVIGALLPLASILLITFGNGVALIAAGQACLLAAGNFQSMGSAAVRNNLDLAGKTDDYPKLFARSNTLYTALSMAAAMAIPAVFAVNRYLPCAACIVTYVILVILSFSMKDRSESYKKEKSGRRKKSEAAGRNDDDRRINPGSVKISASMKYMLIVFCLFFCAAVVFSQKSELMLSNTLSGRFSEEKTIFIFGFVVWLARVVRLCTDMLLHKVIGSLKDNIILAGSVSLLAAFVITGAAGIFMKDSAAGIVLMALPYILIKGIIWDPLRSFLRMTAVDTNSRQRQRFMLVMLNAGQSAVSIILDFIVVIALKAMALEYVFLIFAGITALEVIFAVKLTKKMKNEKELLAIAVSLTEESIDDISLQIEEIARRYGSDEKAAVTYRLLVEERLFEKLQNGQRDEQVEVRLTDKLDEIQIQLRVGGEQIDVFAIPQQADAFSVKIYKNLMFEVGR